MPFTDVVKDLAFRRSGGQCECTHRHAAEGAPYHAGRCKKVFQKQSGRWSVHAKVPIDKGGLANLANCEVLCTGCSDAVIADNAAAGE